MKKTIWLAIIGLALSVGVFGQAKKISREDYYNAYRQALKKFQNVPSRRETSKEESFADGKLSETLETITENINPDRWRFVVIEKSDSRNSESDLIRIGKSYYCRQDNGKWTNSTGGCNQGWATGFTNIVSEQYFVETRRENGKSVRFYRNYTLHKLKDGANKEVLWYFESKFWLAEDGSFLRQETESGLKETNQIRRKSMTSYEYNPKNLKIEAPMK